jgi:hypothetical protein
VAAAPAWADGPYVENRTAWTLYVQHGEGTYRQVPAGGILPAPEGGEVRGFAYERGALSFPAFSVRAGSQDEFIEVDQSDFRGAEQVEASAVQAIISGPRIDNQFLDWIAVPPLVARGRGRAPLGSFIDEGGSRSVLALPESLLWERAGTDLEWIKTRVIGQDALLATSSYSARARSSTLFLYLYENTDTFPRATLEINVGTRESLVLMWVPVLPEPIVVGNSAATEYFTEAQLWLDVIGNSLGALPADGYLEISTASSAAGVWEEFVLARVPIESIAGP